jgi:hypothetical protein
MYSCVQFALCVWPSEVGNHATCSVLIQTNIANKHMRISEPLSSQIIDCFQIITIESCRNRTITAIFRFSGWIHFSSTVFESSQPSRAERNVLWKVFRGIKCNLNIIAFHVSLFAGCPQSSANHPHSSASRLRTLRVISHLLQLARTHCKSFTHISLSLSLCILVSLSLSLPDTHTHYLSFLFHTAF